MVRWTRHRLKAEARHQLMPLRDSSAEAARQGTVGIGCGRPYIRESCGRGNMDDNTIMNSTDTSRFTAARNGTIWDPRADLDDDGDGRAKLRVSTVI